MCVMPVMLPIESSVVAKARRRMDVTLYDCPSMVTVAGMLVTATEQPVTVAESALP